MKTNIVSTSVLLAALAGQAMAGSVSVNYGFTSGENPGAAASAVWTITGSTLTIAMTNTSVFDGSPIAGGAWLLASINFALPTGTTFNTAGAKSVALGAGSSLVGTWDGTLAGNWELKNGSPSNDTPNASSFKQVITTLQGDASGGTRFGAGGPGNLNGPKGGILSSASAVGGLYGALNTLVFTTTLSGTITDAQLRTVADRSVVTFNSHGSFANTVSVVPLPSGAYAGMGMLAGLMGLGALRRRRLAAA